MINRIEDGTVPSGLTSSSEFAYPVHTADVTNIPGATATINYNQGVSVISIDLVNLAIVISGDWTNRRALENENSFYMRRNGLSKKFFYSHVKPDYSLLVPTTKIILNSSMTLTQDLYDFVGTAGTPSAIATVTFGDRIQNPLQENPTSEYKIERFIDGNDYSAKLSWKDRPDVTKHVLRWRPVPKLKRMTNLQYTVQASGEYSSPVVANVTSQYGSGESILPICTVTNVEVLEGGEYTGTPVVSASSIYGSGASFSVSMTGNAIESVQVISGGINYAIPPDLTIIGTEITPASLKSYIGVTGIQTISHGIDYVSAPTVTITGTGTGATVTATPTVYNSGQVDYVEVVNAGSGYANGDQLVFIGGGGTGAKAHVLTDDDGGITHISMIDNGYGYTGSPSASVTSENGIGATMQPIVTLFQDWNYISLTSSTSYTITGLFKTVEYEWQVFSATADRNEQYFNSPVQKFKFF